MRNNKGWAGNVGIESRECATLLSLGGKLNVEYNYKNPTRSRDIFWPVILRCWM